MREEVTTEPAKDPYTVVGVFVFLYINNSSARGRTIPCDLPDECVPAVDLSSRMRKGRFRFKVSRTDLPSRRSGRRFRVSVPNFLYRVTETAFVQSAHLL